MSTVVRTITHRFWKDDSCQGEYVDLNETDFYKLEALLKLSRTDGISTTLTKSMISIALDLNISQVTYVIDGYMRTYRHKLEG